jgi:hypothetical protein
MELATHKADEMKAKPDESNLGFGIHFTDHMFNNELITPVLIKTITGI